MTDSMIERGFLQIRTKGDTGGELIRTEKENLKFLFTESYKAWIKVAHNIKARHHDLELVWQSYCAARDMWIGISY